MRIVEEFGVAGCFCERYVNHIGVLNHLTSMYSFQNMNGRAHKRAIYDGECARLVDRLTGNIIYNAAEVERDVAANIAAFEQTYRQPAD